MWREHHPRRHIERFKYATEGIVYAFKQEANFRIHIFSALLAVALGILVNLSITHWILLVSIITFILVLEMINTIFEIIVDHLWEEEHPRAKAIKDIAAGVVFVGAIGAAIAGILLFWPYFHEGC